jgi:hypothetical protein
MQTLTTSSSAEQVKFQDVFYDSLVAMRSLAGINAIIVEVPKRHPWQEDIILVIDVKSPHLLSSAIKFSACCHEYESGFSRLDEYDSLTICPPTPPPMRA